MKAGWRFTIPIFTRVGNGYVYSSKHISKEDAEAELRESIGEYVAPANHLKMKCGYHKEIAVKNVIAVGLSAGFVEPLEATGITFTTGAVMSIVDLLNNTGNIWNTETKGFINRGFSEMSEEILAFVWAHYYFSSRDDTPYWKEIREQKLEDMPKFIKDILSAFLPYPQRFLNLTPSSMFNITQWFSVLHAGGAYKDIEPYLTKTQERYGQYFVDSNNARLDLVEKMFKNQYEYLTDWYDR